MIVLTTPSRGSLKSAPLTASFSRRFAPRECGGNSRDCHPGTNRRENLAVNIDAPCEAASYRRINPQII